MVIGDLRFTALIHPTPGEPGPQSAPAASVKLVLASYTARPTFSFTVQTHYLLQPLHATSQAFPGVAAPIRVEFVDASGANISAATIGLTAVEVIGPDGTHPATPVGKSASGDQFVFDPSLGSGGGYRFNLDISHLQAGAYALVVRVNASPSGSTTVPFAVR